MEQVRSYGHKELVNQNTESINWLISIVEMTPLVLLSHSQSSDQTSNILML
ncbi:hypothetical protein [Neptuniibacter sp. QD37_11]|uniref:hypothetical protein n=1 Tax=Neptuniibacter sp. QD37_11 TaxID=3398209 RepID=UPI0039F47A4C